MPNLPCNHSRDQHHSKVISFGGKGKIAICTSLTAAPVAESYNRQSTENTPLIGTSAALGDGLWPGI